MSAAADLLPCELWQVLLIDKPRHIQKPPAVFCKTHALRVSTL